LDSYTLVRTDIGQYAPSLFEQGWNLLVDMSRWFQGYATTKDFLVISQQYFRPSEIVTPEALVEVARTKMSLRRQLTHEEAQMAILMVLHKSTVIEAEVAVILKNLRAD
jgi:hypothetical protein